MSPRTAPSSILAETVRAACLDAAMLAYEDAGIRGLCAEGRWEAALAAMRQLELSGVLESEAGSALDDTAQGGH
jgi:pentatricopeptide repeat protein